MGKVTAKTELLTATGDDILYIVEDPAGTPASRKISVANLIGSDAVLEIIRDEVGDNVLQGDKGVTVTPSDVANTVTIATDGVLEDLDTLGPATTDGQIIVATGAGAFAYESGSTARASLGVTIGTHVQAWDENLDQIAALTPASSLMIGNGAGAWTTVTPASFITNNNILDTADIGSSVQAHGAVLDDLNTLGAPTTDGQFLVATGAGAFAYESGATARTSIGLGNVENTALSTWSGSAAITTLGTVATGTWQAGVIDSAYIDPTLSVTTITSSGAGTFGSIVVAGADTSTLVKGEIFVATGANALSQLTLGTNGQYLTVDTSTATGVKWSSIPGGSTTFDGLLDVSLSGTQSTNDVLKWNGTHWVDTDTLSLAGLTVSNAGGQIDINTDGAGSTFIGWLAGSNNNTPAATDGENNTFVGYRSGELNTSGYASAFFGFKAGGANTTGGRNTFLGYQSGLFNSSGSNNVFIGVDAGYGNTVSDDSVIIGYHAGLALNPASGSAGNTLVGYETMVQPSTATLNTALGWRAAYRLTGNQNTMVGHSAGYFTTTGRENAFYGENAGRTNATGSYNTYLGTRAAYTATTSNNTAVGAFSVFSISTGANLTALGYNAGRFIASGGDNTTSGNSVYLGYDTRASADGNTNEIVIGYSAIGNGSNTATYGNASITAHHFAGSVRAATSFVAASDLTLASGSITSASGAISFGNEAIAFGNAVTITADTGATPQLLVDSSTDLSSVIRVRSTAANSFPYFSIVNDAREFRLQVDGSGSDQFLLYDATAAATRLSVSTAGAFDFQSGSITTTGTLASGAATVTGALSVSAGITSTRGGNVTHATLTNSASSESVTLGWQSTDTLSFNFASVSNRALAFGNSGAGVLNVSIDGSLSSGNATVAGTLGVTGNLTVDTNTLYVDATANAVRIGTTSATSHGTEALRVSTSSVIAANISNSGSDGSLIQFTNSTTGSSASDGFQIGIDASELGYIYNLESTAIRFGTAGTERFRVAADAYAIGIGTTDVESWSSQVGAVEFYGSAIMGGSSGATDLGLYVLNNAYFDGAWKYKRAAAASNLWVDDGQFIFRTIGSGAADASITWSEKMRLTNGGMLLVGDSANANMTVGLTINQGANDDEIISLKSSDISHGLTTFAEDDSFATFQKFSSTTGGLRIRSLAEDAAVTNLQFTVYGGTANTTKGTTGIGLVDFIMAARSGTSITDVAANGNIFSLSVRSGAGAEARWIADEDGDTWQAGSLTTGAPSGGTAAPWKLGTVSATSPTSPNRTIEVDINGTIYYIHAKTTND